jgi:capsular polysaccharide biosynthesis protein
VPESSPDPADLMQAVRVLRRRKAVVLGAAAVLVVVAILVTSLRETPYEATAEVLLRRPSAVGSTGDATDPARAIQNEIRLIESDVVRDRVAVEIGRDATIDVTAGADDDLLSFTAREDDASAAAAVANAYARAYLDVRIDELTAEADALRQQIDGIDERLVELPRPPSTEADATAELDPAVTEERTRLAAERAELQSSLLAVEARLAGVGDQPRLVTWAAPPSEPISGGLGRNATVALVLGLLIGALVAGIVELLDQRVHDQVDVERASGLANLAVVELGPRRKSVTAASGTYQALLRGILPPPAGEPARQVVAVVPVVADSGAADIVAGLGRACTAAGKRVLLIASDLRGSRLARVLSSSRARVDVVLVKAGPAVGGGDGPTVAASADATVLVVAARTAADDVRRAVTDLIRSGATLRGTVLVTRPSARHRIRSRSRDESKHTDATSLPSRSDPAEPAPTADIRAPATLEEGQDDHILKRAHP